MEKRLLLIGVDPGATIGHAILDINGNLLELGSSKNSTLSSLRLKLISLGKTVAISTDKNPPPKFVSALSKSLGARLFFPRQDLKIEEKKDLIRGFKIKNNHQRDALSSVMFAYKKMTPILNKIKKHTTKENFEQVTQLVILKKLSISQAIILLEQRPQLKIEQKQVIQNPTKINPIKEQNQILISENKRLKQTINDLYLQKQKILSLLDQKKIIQKQKAIQKITKNSYQELEKQIQEQKDQINNLKKKIQTQNKFFSSLNDKIIIKKLDSLSFLELSEKLDVLDIKKGEMLYVKNPNNFSQKTLEFLKDNENTVIVPKKSHIDDLKQIEQDGLDLEEIENYAKVSKSKLEQKINQKTLLFEIIQDYKEKRQKNYISSQ